MPVHYETTVVNLARAARFVSTLMAYKRLAYLVVLITDGQAYYYHRVETYRDVTSVPTFFVRMHARQVTRCKHLIG